MGALPVPAKKTIVEARPAQSENTTPGTPSVSAAPAAPAGACGLPVPAERTIAAWVSANPAGALLLQDAVCWGNPVAGLLWFIAAHAVWSLIAYSRNSFLGSLTWATELLLLADAAWRIMRWLNLQRFLPASFSLSTSPSSQTKR